MIDRLASLLRRGRAPVMRASEAPITVAVDAGGITIDSSDRRVSASEAATSVARYTLRASNWSECDVGTAERAGVAGLDPDMAADLTRVRTIGWPIRIDRQEQRHPEVFDLLAGRLASRGPGSMTIGDLQALERQAIADLASGDSGRPELKEYLHWSL